MSRASFGRGMVDLSKPAPGPDYQPREIPGFPSMEQVRAAIAAPVDIAANRLPLADFIEIMGWSDAK